MSDKPLPILIGKDFLHLKIEPVRPELGDPVLVHNGPTSRLDNCVIRTGESSLETPDGLYLDISVYKCGQSSLIDIVHPGAVVRFVLTEAESAPVMRGTGTIVSYVNDFANVETAQKECLIIRIFSVSRDGRPI